MSFFLMFFLGGLAAKSAATQAALPPPQEGRNALLDSIKNPNPLSRLKKTTPPKR